MIESAGTLLYRRNGDDVQVLIAHPGGPIWSRRDAGAWSLPKGAPNDGEELFATARREFQEETGHRPPDGHAIDLGDVRMRLGDYLGAETAYRSSRKSFPGGPVEQAKDHRPATERAGDEGGQEGVDHLAGEVVEQRHQRQALDRGGNGRGRRFGGAHGAGS